VRFQRRSAHSQDHPVPRWAAPLANLVASTTKVGASDLARGSAQARISTAEGSMVMGDVADQRFLDDGSFVKGGRLGQV
jgi:hypothetical protein